ALAQLLMRLLEKEPAKRPKTAAEVARALEDPAVVSGTFVSAQAPKQQRPRRVLWALAGAGILASVAAGSAWFTNHRPPASGAVSVSPTPLAKSIAVLPLVNISPDTADAYIAAGMTAQVTNALSRVPGLRVMSTTDTKPEKLVTPTDAGKALNATMVLVGTVQRDKNRMRVTARLVNTSDGLTVWSDMFESESMDVFKVQDEISIAIVAAIFPDVARPRAKP